MSYLDNTGVEYLVADIKGKTDAAYQAKLVSGTNIKTVNNESLLGSGNITVEGGTALTTQEVEDAVDAAFVVMYSINDELGCKSITTDGSYGTDVSTITTEAREGTTVTIAKNGNNTFGVRNVSTSVNLTTQYITTFGTYYVYSFTMPDSAVLIYLR